MKTSSSAVKILTVSVFATFIILFVCYRVGVFDNDSISDAYSEADLASNSLTAVDTPIVNQDSVLMYREMMSSSKSMVLHKPIIYDTVKKVVPADTTKKKPLKKTTMMSSSKSAYIYEAEPTDTAKKPKK